MARKMYGIYDKDGIPMFIGNSRECAAYLGIKYDSFRKQVYRTKKGRRYVRSHSVYFEYKE